MTVADLLRTHFDRTGEKQAEFARRIGVTPQTISQIVRGDIKVPTADIRRKLAAAFNLRHTDILVMVGELSADELPKPGAVAQPFERGTVKAKIVELLHEVSDVDALEVAKFCQFQIDKKDIVIDIPVIIGGAPRS